MPRNRKRTKVGSTNATKSESVAGKPPGPDLINTLNDDCLARIFMQLSIRNRLEMQRVCKRWWQNPRLVWGDLRVLDSDKTGLPASLMHNSGISRILRQAGCFLRELRLIAICSSRILPFIAENCPNLTSLDIVLSYRDKSCTKWYPEMTRLKVFKMEGEVKHFSENLVSNLPFQSLTELDLTVTSPVSLMAVTLPRAMPSAIERLTKLQSLTLRGFALTPTLLTVINQHSAITYLSLPNCSAKRGLPPLDRLVNLKHLNLARISTVTDQFVLQISETCKKLTYLKLTYCEKVSDDGIKKLHTLPLEELYLTGLYKISDQHLGQLHTLRKLECSCCDYVEDNGILTLLRFATQLEYLNVYNTGVTFKVLDEAANMMKRRANEIPFRIFASINAQNHVADADWVRFVIFNRPSAILDSDNSDDSSAIDTDSD